MCLCGKERRLSPSDRTDHAWAILDPLSPAARGGGRPQEVERRGIVSGMVSVMCSGCPWCLLPCDVPTRRTVSRFVREWKQAGIWEPVHAAFRWNVRGGLGHDPDPRAVMLERHSITTRSVRGDERGYDS